MTVGLSERPSLAKMVKLDASGAFEAAVEAAFTAGALWATDPNRPIGRIDPKDAFRAWLAKPMPDVGQAGGRRLRPWRLEYKVGMGWYADSTHSTLGRGLECYRKLRDRTRYEWRILNRNTREVVDL